jgi:hypothetical protein
MKMAENSKNKRVEDILNSLEGIQPARADDFLFGKIANKIKEPFTATRVIPLRTVSVAAASILLLLALNVLMLSKKHEQKAPSGDPMQQLVDYYGLNENQGI